jgi:DNA-binding transcriptional LysR family regulator
MNHARRSTASAFFNSLLVGESVDVALRIGVLNDSTAVARKIGAVHRVVVAAPAYLARAGTPSVPGDLTDHAIIIGPANRVMEGWTFRRDGKASSVRVEGRFILNGMEAAAAAAIAGLGILSTGDLGVMSELETGRRCACFPIGRWDRWTSTSCFPRAELRSRLPTHSRTSWRPSFGKCRPPGVGVNASPVKCSLALAWTAAHRKSRSPPMVASSMRLTAATTSIECSA